MYTPEAFKVEDRATLEAFMRQHSFATLVTHENGSSHASHLPVVLRETSGPLGSLRAHLARANPQRLHLENEGEVLVIFTGPHAYISPAWYLGSPAVPTWNYTAVHVYGRPKIVEDPEAVSDMLLELVETHERNRPERWDGKMPDDFLERLMKGIVAFEIEITRIEGKFKLSQNREEDVPGVFAALTRSDHPGDREIAALMGSLFPESCGSREPR